MLSKNGTGFYKLGIAKKVNLSDFSYSELSNLHSDIFL